MIWVDEKAKGRHDALLGEIDSIFRVPPEIAAAEPHIFHEWFYGRQCAAAHLRIEAAMLFLTFTKSP